MPPLSFRGSIDLTGYEKIRGDSHMTATKYRKARASGHTQTYYYSSSDQVL